MIQMVSGADFKPIFQLLGLTHPRTRLYEAHGLINHQKTFCYLDKMLRGYGRPKHMASETRRPRALEIEANQCVNTIELLMWNTK